MRTEKFSASPQQKLITIAEWIEVMISDNVVNPASQILLPSKSVPVSERREDVDRFAVLVSTWQASLTA